MSLAVITDSSVNLPTEIQGHADVYILDIPVIVEEQPFVEGKNLDVNQFYEKMANSEELLKTSQPNLADLDNLLMELGEQGYTHVIGLFLSSGISGFWANSQFLIEDHAKLKVAFHETKITAAPMGYGCYGQKRFALVRARNVIREYFEEAREASRKHDGLYSCG